MSAPSRQIDAAEARAQTEAFNVLRADAEAMKATFKPDHFFVIDRDVVQASFEHNHHLHAYFGYTTNNELTLLLISEKDDIDYGNDPNSSPYIYQAGYDGPTTVNILNKEVAFQEMTAWNNQNNNCINLLVKHTPDGFPKANQVPLIHLIHELGDGEGLHVFLGWRDTGNTDRDLSLLFYNDTSNNFVGPTVKVNDFTTPVPPYPPLSPTVFNLV